MINKKGFTLMEVIIVIAILAALAAIGMPTFSGIINKSKAETCMTNNESIISNYNALITNDSAIVDFSAANPGTKSSSEIVATMLDSFKTALSETGCDSSTASFAGTGGFTFTAQCGNSATATLDPSTNQITKITCSVHGTR